MKTATIKAYDTAYPGSMMPRDDGYYLERNDHKSMAAALVELIASRDREIEDLREALHTARGAFIGLAIKKAEGL